MYLHVGEFRCNADVRAVVVHTRSVGVTLVAEVLDFPRLRRQLYETL